jgi:cytochrome P450
MSRATPPHSIDSTTGPGPLAGYSWRDVTPEQALELYEQARQSCPVAHSERLGGFHLLIDYADVKQAMSDWKTFSSCPTVLRPVSDRPPFPPLEYDPPQHRGWSVLTKQLLNPKTPTVIEDAVRRDVDRCIDGFAPSGTCDLVRDLALPIPLLAICHIFGLGDEQADEVHRLTNNMFGAIGSDQEQPTREAFEQFVMAEVETRRRGERDDGLALIARSTIDDRPLADEEILRFVTGTLAAGHGTAVAGMASLFDEVLSRPDVRAELLADPSLVPRAIEETLRLRPPIFGFYRNVTTRVTVRETSIEAGESVFMAWAAANRDPEQFENPGTFDLHRKPNRHLSFGHGIHACLGAPVARAEMQIALTALLERLPDIEIDHQQRGDYVFAMGDGPFLTSLPARFRPQSS